MLRILFRFLARAVDLIHGDAAFAWMGAPGLGFIPALLTASLVLLSSRLPSVATLRTLAKYADAPVTYIVMKWPFFAGMVDFGDGHFFYRWFLWAAVVAIAYYIALWMLEYTALGSNLKRWLRVSYGNCYERRSEIQYMRPVGPWRKVVLNALDDEDSEIRKTAALLLGRELDPAGYEPIFAILLKGSSTRQVREEAANCLAAYKRFEDLPRFLEALKEGLPVVRAIVSLNAPGTLESLIECLDNSPDSREYTAQALGLLRDRRAIEPLRRYLLPSGCRAHIVRPAVAEALMQLGYREINHEQLEALKEFSLVDCVKRLIAKHGDGCQPAVPAWLFDALLDRWNGLIWNLVGRHESSYDIEGTVECFGLLGDIRAVELLLLELRRHPIQFSYQAFEGPDVYSSDSITITIIRVLGEFRDLRAVETLQRLRETRGSLKDVPKVRQAAEKALSQLLRT